MHTDLDAPPSLNQPIAMQMTKKKSAKVALNRENAPKLNADNCSATSPFRDDSSVSSINNIANG